jgi:hypothetical protein
MIDNAEQTVIEFRRRIVAAEAVLAMRKKDMEGAARDLKDAKMAMDKLLDEMSSPQMALPFGKREPAESVEAPEGQPVDPPAEVWTPASSNGDAVEAEPGEVDWRNEGVEILFDHGMTAPDARCLKKSGIAKFGDLIDFAGGGKQLDSLPGIGAKGAERINAAIMAWADANPA